MAGFNFDYPIPDSVLSRDNDRLHRELERAYACIREMQRLALARNLSLERHKTLVEAVAKHPCAFMDVASDIEAFEAGEGQRLKNFYDVAREEIDGG